MDNPYGPLIYVNSDVDIHNLIKSYGKGMVLSMCVEDILIYIKFTTHTLRLALQELHAGGALYTAREVIMEISGNELFMHVDEMKDDQLPENKAILNRLYDRFYKAYVAKYKKKFEGIDLEIDPITCDTMINPAYIKTDWDNNCKIVYSLDTILKFYANKMRYTSFDVDAAGNDIYYEEQIPLHFNYFISPYTQNKFDMDDINHVKLDLLKN
jgi:hypothetical protein